MHPNKALGEIYIFPFCSTTTIQFILNSHSLYDENKITYIDKLKKI